MPECKTCGNMFPNLHRHNGKIHNISSRRYCLSCNPFKSRRGKPPAPNGRVCQRCDRPFVYRRETGQKLDLCAACVQTVRRLDIKCRLVAIKGGKCQRCGYDRYIGALAFHHRDPTKKVFPVGGNHNRSWEANVAEANKCDLLCHNCHAEVHHEIHARL